ncbi:probable methyltransferase-like protein 24 [Phyllopteryx taeniolatus]|uniref:probable methyltransferase-like protein 24 n=1 Tax=Phyllopteryx taeniolatus TaxID=161469 RepID=UPI002AD53C97|nr:probable methyltransferase-like protein 24 [Phyllopteryx taeniolatus]
MQYAFFNETIPSMVAVCGPVLVSGPAFADPWLELQPWAPRPLRQHAAAEVLQSSLGGSRAGEPPPPTTPADEWLLPPVDTLCVTHSFSTDSVRTTTSLGCHVRYARVAAATLWSVASTGCGRSGGRRRGRRAPGRRVAKVGRHHGRLGHRTVHFLYADLLSTEWRDFQNRIELGTLRRVHRPVARVHLQWAGFRVGGGGVADERVPRYWLGVLRAAGHSASRKRVAATRSASSTPDDDVPSRWTFH